ncbi:MAG: hypothetical protein QNL04_13950 [SAR324 cluster bacterium]|nr:hypothetical protein [SAR324 cluster bacterium]
MLKRLSSKIPQYLKNTPYSENNKLISIFFGLILSFILLLFLSQKSDYIKFDEVALGTDTKGYLAQIDGHSIHTTKMSEFSLLKRGFELRKLKKTALWLGNSQLHAINQYKEGQENASPILLKKLSALQTDLLTLSFANANLQEHYLVFEYSKVHLPIKILYLGIVFDDFRETGIRADLGLIFQEEEVKNNILKNALGRQLVKAYSSKSPKQTNIIYTHQEVSENYLNKLLKGNSLIWRSRDQLQGKFKLQLYRARNNIFQIDATTTRKIIPSRYRANMTALKEILSSAAASKIQVITYIVPLRHDVAYPYLKSQYLSFKKEVDEIARALGARHLDIDQLVPGKYWGVKNSTTGSKGKELDFMHFQAKGHQLLANELYKETRALNIEKPTL